MNKRTHQTFAPLVEAPLDDDHAVEGLLAEAVAEASLPASLPVGRAQALRTKVLGRVASSAEKHRGLLTARERNAQWTQLAPGARERLLFAAAQGSAASLRPGQPLHAAIVQLDAGAQLPASFDSAELQREWLLLSGDLQISAQDIGDVHLGLLAYHVAPAGCVPRTLRTQGGAVFYVRRAPATAGTQAAVQTNPDEPTAWVDLGNKLHRRVLWTGGEEASYLIRAEQGASVPAHGHAHDEECLMIQGDLFLGDVLLRTGDYQLAPAGVRHGDHYTDTGLTVLVRGDLEMRFDL